MLFKWHGIFCATWEKILPNIRLCLVELKSKKVPSRAENTYRSSNMGQTNMKTAK